MAEAQRGQRFILQGGDCAESFEDCTSGAVVSRLKILLQMSLVLLHGLKVPVTRIGRMAGQYAKPRSADTETRDGITLPCYRGDIVNRPGFTPAEREPDPMLLLRGSGRRPQPGQDNCQTKNTGHAAVHTNGRLRIPYRKTSQYSGPASLIASSGEAAKGFAPRGTALDISRPCAIVQFEWFRRGCC